MTDESVGIWYYYISSIFKGESTCCATILWKSLEMVAVIGEYGDVFFLCNNDEKVLRWAQIYLDNSSCIYVSINRKYSDSNFVNLFVLLHGNLATKDNVSFLAVMTSFEIIPVALTLILSCNLTLHVPITNHLDLQATRPFTSNTLCTPLNFKNRLTLPPNTYLWMGTRH